MRFVDMQTRTNRLILAAVIVSLKTNFVVNADPPIVHQSSVKETPGVTGENTAGGHGVFGKSDNGHAVFGSSVDYAGVVGETESKYNAGVVGINKKGDFGVVGRCDNGSGVAGYSHAWTGVYGFSNGSNGILGETEANGPAGVAGVNKKDGNGVYGRCDGNGNGVSGTCDNGRGVAGWSRKGPGVGAFSQEWSGIFAESDANDGHCGIEGHHRKNGSGVFGFCHGLGTGVHGRCDNGRGVFGEGRTGPGVFGISVGDHGVFGETEAIERAGIAGVNKQHGNGVYGRSDGQGNGVYGTSSDGRGVVGDSRSHDGVLGVAHVEQKSGVVGLNDHAAGYGVWAASLQGTGLYAKGVTGAIIGTNNGVALRIVAESEAKATAAPAAPLVEAIVGESHRVFSVSKSGEVSATSIQTSRPQVAEQVELSEPAEPGDVIEIDPEQPGAFRPTRTANSAAVAGVLVTSPGIALSGEETTSSEPDHYLALLGRVSVKVTSENGAIHPGDLLVASSTRGRAMKAPADPKPGTLIGKALGILREGERVMEILVMLR
jgi:hypothetical protein